MSPRKSISINIQRRLWANCAGYCQNPNCNKYLFIDEDFISSEEVDSLIEEVQLRLSDLATKLHFQCCAKKEFKQLKMRFDNKQKIF